MQKVLLSMRHRTLVPTLNVSKENSHCDFKNSPFYISREKQAWDVAPRSLRRAAVSAFGFSGTNAHLVIEEYLPPAEQAVPSSENKTVIVPLSARTVGAATTKGARSIGVYPRGIVSAGGFGCRGLYAPNRQRTNARTPWLCCELGRSISRKAEHVYQRRQRHRGDLSGSC